MLTLWPGGHREAPAIVKKGDYYFLMTSGCTGWAPNQGKYAYSKSLGGPWSDLMDIGDETTFKSQSTFILPLQVKNDIRCLYIGDRWDAGNYHNSRYIYLYLDFPAENKMELKWKDSYK